MHIPDPMEQMDAAIDRLIEAGEQCFLCGKAVAWNHMMPLNERPDSPGICPECDYNRTELTR